MCLVCYNFVPSGEEKMTELRLHHNAEYFWKESLRGRSFPVSATSVPWLINQERKGHRQSGASPGEE